MTYTVSEGTLQDNTVKDSMCAAIAIVIIQICNTYGCCVAVASAEPSYSSQSAMATVLTLLRPVQCPINAYRFKNTDFPAMNATRLEELLCR